MLKWDCGQIHTKLTELEVILERTRQPLREAQIKVAEMETVDGIPDWLRQKLWTLKRDVKAQPDSTIDRIKGIRTDVPTSGFRPAPDYQSTRLAL